MDKWEKLRSRLKGKPITACGGIVRDPSRYSYREYNGMRFYFCNQECLRAFEDDPDGFMSGDVLHPVAQEDVSHSNHLAEKKSAQ